MYLHQLWVRCNNIIYPESLFTAYMFESTTIFFGKRAKCVCMRVQDTCDLVQALSGDVVVLVDPLAVAFEVDLGGGRCFAGEFHWSVLHDECVLRLALELRQRLSWRRGEGVRQYFTVVTAIYTHAGKTIQWLRFCANDWKMMRVLRPADGKC